MPASLNYITPNQGGPNTTIWSLPAVQSFFGMKTSSLGAATKFFSGLNYGSKAFPVPYHILYGICDVDGKNVTTGTETSFTLTTTTSSSGNNYVLTQNWTTQSGDTVVPAWSASFNNGANLSNVTVYPAFDDNHGDLAKDTSMTGTLAKVCAIVGVS